MKSRFNNKFFNNIQAPETDKLEFERVIFEKFDPSVTQKVIQEPVVTHEDRHALEDEMDLEPLEISFDDARQQTKQSYRVKVTRHNQMEPTADLWIAHTNQEISSDLTEKIAGLPGIETLTIMSRYRFRFGSGKMFENEQVRALISETINKHAEETEE